MIIDTNVYVSHWPFRRLPGDELSALIAKLREHNVTEAWAGSFDGILHEDVGGVNKRLAETCRTAGEGLLIPFGTVNPTLPDWEEDLRRCREEYGMPGIRLHPSYHGYSLDDPRFADLLRQAAERKLTVQLVLNMEDTRTQHPLVQVTEPDTGPVLKLLPQIPGLRLVIQNRKREPSGKLLGRLSYQGEVYFDFAMLEGVGAIAKLIEEIPSDRVLFGSHYPFFYFESALFKVKESGLSESRQKAIFSENASLVLEP
jgi:hypothetical protein